VNGYIYSIYTVYIFLFDYLETGHRVDKKKQILTFASAAATAVERLSGKVAGSIPSSAVCVSTLS